MKNNKILKILIIIFSLIVGICIGIGIYEITTVNNTYYKNEKNLRIPIFVYHNIVNEKSEIEFDYMQTTKETFEKQMVGLIKLGYKPITYQDLIEYNEGKKAIYKHSFIVTFDDGFLGVYENAYPIIEKYNIPITCFIINHNVGTSGYFTWEQAKEMNQSGLVDICSHSMEHLEYDKVSPEYLLEDVTNSFNEIDSKLGITTKRIFCYPYGLYTVEEQIKLKDAGIIQNLTDNRINESNNLNLYGLHRDYPLNDSVIKIVLKIIYRSIRYGG